MSFTFKTPSPGDKRLSKFAPQQKTDLMIQVCLMNAQNLDCCVNHHYAYYSSVDTCTWDHRAGAVWKVKQLQFQQAQLQKTGRTWPFNRNYRSTDVFWRVSDATRSGISRLALRPKLNLLQSALPGRSHGNYIVWLLMKCLQKVREHTSESCLRYFFFFYLHVVHTLKCSWS